MDLHRVEGAADWSQVPPENRNAWQKIAAGTGGVVTVGNFFSVLGLLSVPLALYLIITHKAYLDGVAVLAIGRVCDLLDGILADKTGTKSPLGEKIDASFDKASTLLAVAGLAISGLVPWWALLVLLSPHLFIAGMAIAAYRRGHIIHPSLAGKLSMAAAWVSLLAFVLQGGIENWVKAGLLTILAYTVLAVSAVLSLAAVRGYAREITALRKNPKRADP